MPHPLARALAASSIPPGNQKAIPRVEGVGFTVGIGAGLLLALVAVLFFVGRK